MRGPRWRLVSLTAAATALFVMVLTTIVWVVLERGKDDPGAAGTLTELTPAPGVGLWVPAGHVDLVEAVAVTGQAPVTVDGFDTVPGIEAGTRSWLVQVTAVAIEPARVWVSGGEASRNGAALLTVHTEPKTVTTLLDVGDDGAIALTSDGDAELTVTAIAAFTGSAEREALGPGGTRAVDPAPALRAGNGDAPIPTTRQPAWVSPAGLGAVPSQHVSGGWLQITATGSGTVLMGSKEEQAPVLDLVGGSGSALIPTGLDTDGLVWLSTTGSVTALSVDVVGWTAAADPTMDATVVDGGLVLAAPSGGGSPTAPSSAPAGAVGLWSFQVDSGDRVPGTGELAGRALAGDQASGAGQVLSATTARGGEATGTWRGYFAVWVTEAARADLSVTIDHPRAGARIDLADTGGEVTFSGTVAGAEGLRSVVLLREERYLGTAEVSLTADGHAWRYLTDAAPGEHTVTVRVEDLAGRRTEHRINFEAVAPADRSTPVVAARTVIGGTDLVRTLTAVTDDSLTLAEPADLRVGDHLVAEPSELLPDGRIATVTAIRREGAGMVVHTRPAGLDEIFLQVHFVQTGEAVPREVPKVSNSYRIDSPDQPVVGVDAPHAGPVSLAPGVVRDVIELVDDSWEVASLDLVGTFAGQADYRDGKTSREVEASSETTVQVDVNGARLVDEVYPQSWRKELAGTTTVAASANFDATLELHATSTVNFTLRTHINWEWFDSKVVVDEFKLSQTQAFDEKLSMNATGEFQQFMDADTFNATPAERVKTLKDAAREAASAKDASDPDAKSLEERLTAKLGTAKFTVAAVPVWINVYATINMAYGSYLTGEISGVQSFGYTHEIGVQWRDGEWSEINSFQLTSQAQEARFSIDALASFVSFVTFKAMVYDVAGPTLDLSLMLELTAHAEGEAHNDAVEDDTGASVSADVSLDLYGFGSVGAEVDLLSFEDEWHSPELTLFTINIWKRHWEACAGDSCPDDAAAVPAAENDSETSAVGRGDRPLVLLMDTSSSMEGQRIENAKASLRGVLQAQQLGTEIGLYTYPGGNTSSTGDCTTGQFVIPVEPVSGFGNLLTAIDQVQTDGDTPTGEALLAVADALEAQGRTGATILLVSDGETTCGVPPCEVATQLGQRGFEVTIPTVAYQTSAQGAAELACIAEATGAQPHVIDSDDPEELWNTVEDLTLASLELAVSHPDTVASDGAATVEVSVHNPSARDVAAARVSLTAEGLAARVSPAAEVMLGNIPPGATVTRKVRVTTEQAQTGVVSLRVLAWGRNVTAMEETSSYRVVAPGELETVPGEILAPDDDAQTWTMGDGFADPSCGSGDTTVALAAASSGTSVACEGASTRDLLEPVDGPSQWERLPEASGEVVVQVTVGSGDVGLERLLGQCAVQECPADDARFVNAIRVAQEIDFTALYSDLATRLAEKSDPIVVVTPYPYLFDTSTGRACAKDFSLAEARALNAVVGTLNRAAEAGALASRQRGHEVYYAADVADALLPDASICSARPGVAVSDGLRLTEQGVTRSAEAMARWSQGRSRAEAARPQRGTGVTQGLHPLSWLFPGTVDMRMDAQPPSALVDVRIPQAGRGTVVKGGQALRVSGDGYAPGTSVTISLHQERLVALGTFEVGPDGSFVAMTRLPFGTPVGESLLAVLGVTAGGQSERVLATVHVAAPASMTVSVWTSVWVVSALLALALLGGMWRLRRRLRD